MTAPVRCGRLDVHDPHPWTRPAHLQWPAVTYDCPGPPVVEGGWAYRDAIDDEFETRVDRERREAS